MKKLIKPAETEKAEYYSDFTGKPLCEYGPDITMIMNFSYGSKYDGSAFSLHLDDDDAEDILKYISSKLSADCKNEIKKEIQKFDERYDDAMDSRAWDECDFYSNNTEVLKKLLGL